MTNNFKCFENEKIPLEEIIIGINKIEHRIAVGDLEVIGNQVRILLEKFIHQNYGQVFPIDNHNLAVATNKLLSVHNIKQSSRIAECFNRIRQDSNFDSHDSEVNYSIEIVVGMLEDFHEILKWAVNQSSWLTYQEKIAFTGKAAKFDSDIYYELYEDQLLTTHDKHSKLITEKISAAFEFNKSQNNIYDDVAKQTACSIEAFKITEPNWSDAKIVKIKNELFLINDMAKFLTCPDDGNFTMQLIAHPFLGNTNFAIDNHQIKLVELIDFYKRKWDDLSLLNWLEIIQVIKPISQVKMIESELNYVQNERDKQISIYEYHDDMAKFEIDHEEREIINYPKNFRYALMEYLFVKNNFFDQDENDLSISLNFLQKYECYTGEWIINGLIYEDLAAVIKAFPSITNTDQLNQSINLFEASIQHDDIATMKHTKWLEGEFLGLKAIYLGTKNSPFVSLDHNRFEIKLNWAEIKTEIITMLESDHSINQMNDLNHSLTYTNTPETVDHEVLMHLQRLNMFRTLKG